MDKEIYDIAYNLFQPVVEKFDYLFQPIESKLRVAKIKVPLQKYSAFILFAGMLIFIFTTVMFLIIGTLAFSISLIYFPIYLVLGILCGFGTSAFLYLLPTFAISDRGAKLDNSLPFVTIYLSTISKSGFPPHKMFEFLSRFKEYKIAAEESKKITNDVSVLGLDLPAALTKAMNNSPSDSWTELLAGLRNSITVGGDLGKYLEAKAEGFIQDYKRRLEEFSNLLALLMNVYITLVIVGVVFFVVISSLMATVGGLSVGLIKTLQYALVFIGLPAITAMFILMVKSASPWSN